MNVERDKAQVFNPSVHPLRSPHNLLPLPSNVHGRITSCPLPPHGQPEKRPIVNCSVYPFDRLLIREPSPYLSRIHLPQQIVLTPREARRAHGTPFVLLTARWMLCVERNFQIPMRDLPRLP